MGSHWGSGRDKEPAGACALVVRALAVGAALAASVLMVGVPFAVVNFSATGDGAPASSVGLETAGPLAPVGPTAASAPMPSGDVRAAGLPPQSDAFLTDSRALVPFDRPAVRTVAKGGHPKFNVASAALQRPRAGFLMAPLEVLNPSSPFGFRISPLTGSVGDFHLGQDYAAACGTRVYAADSGVVRTAGWHPWGGGNRVEIDHGNGLITTYNHLQAIAVHTGDFVDVGQVIARVGTTGWSTGCHLHFETILNGKHVNPLNWTFISIRQVDELGNIAMVSYVDGPPSPAGALRWAIPVTPDQSHAVLFGDQELLKPPFPASTVRLPQTSLSQAATPTTTAPPAPTTTAPPAPATTAPTTAPPTPTTTAPPAPATTAPPTPATTAPTPTPTTAPPTPTTTAPTTPATTAPTPTPTTAPPTPTTTAPTTPATTAPTPTPTTAPTTPATTAPSQAPMTPVAASRETVPAGSSPPAKPTTERSPTEAPTTKAPPAEAPTAEPPVGTALRLRLR